MQKFSVAFRTAGHAAAHWHLVRGAVTRSDVSVRAMDEATARAKAAELEYLGYETRIAPIETTALNPAQQKTFLGALLNSVKVVH